MDFPTLKTEAGTWSLDEAKAKGLRRISNEIIREVYPINPKLSQRITNDSNDSIPVEITIMIFE